MANPTGRFEDVRRVIGDDVDAIELGEGLCRHGDEDASSIASEHVTVCSLAFLALEKNIHLDFTVLVAGLGVMDVTTTIQVGDDNDAFLVVVVVQEPSEILSAQDKTICEGVPTFAIPWGLNNDQTSEGKQTAHNALHSQWYAPRSITLYKATEVVYPD